MNASGNHSGAVINHQDQLESKESSQQLKSSNKGSNPVRKSRKQQLIDNNDADTEEHGTQPQSSRPNKGSMENRKQLANS